MNSFQLQAAMYNSIAPEESKAYGDGYQKGHKDGYDKGYDDAMAKYKRAKGKWVKDIQGDTICLNCGFECLYNEEGLYSLGHYCHHCGADMRGDQK